MRPSRSMLAAALAGPFLLLAVAQAQPPGKDRPLSPQQKELLKERDRLEADTRRLENEGKLADAAAAAEKMLALERKVFGDVHADVAGSLNCLASLRELLGAFDEARAARRERLAIRIKLHGKDSWQATEDTFYLRHVDVLARLSPAQRAELARANHWRRQRNQLFDQRKYADAERLDRKALAVQRQILGEAHPATAMSYSLLALDLAWQNKNAEAEPLDRKALAIRRQVFGEDHPSTATSYSNLASRLSWQQKDAEAEAMNRKALAIHRKVLGEDHRDTARSYHNLAVDLRHRQKHAEAEPLDRQALALRRKVLGEDHRDTASSYHYLALDLWTQGKYAAAEEHDRKALAIRRKVLGDDHRDTARSYQHLAGDLSSQGKYAEAERAERAGLAICRKVLGDFHKDTATIYTYLGKHLLRQNRSEETEQLFRQALAIRRKLLGEDHLDTLDVCGGLAACLFLRSNFGSRERALLEEAEQLLQRNLDRYRKRFGDDSPRTVQTLETLVMVLVVRKKNAELEPYRRLLLNVHRKQLGENHFKVAEAYTDLAVTLRRLKKPAEAEALDRKALAIYGKVRGENDRSTLASRGFLAEDLHDQGKYAAAEQLQRELLTALRKAPGKRDWEIAAAYGKFADALIPQGKFAAAEEALQNALDITRRAYGEQDDRTLRQAKQLAGLLYQQAKYPAAEALQRRILAGYEKLEGTRLHAIRPETATACRELAKTLRRLKKEEEAFALDKRGQDTGFPILNRDTLKLIKERPPVPREERETLYRIALAGLPLLRQGELPEMLKDYNARADKADKQQKYGEAMSLDRQALAFCRALFGPDHLATAACLNNLGVTSKRVSLGKSPEALRLHQAALASLRKLLGEEHLLIAACCSNLAADWRGENKHAEAEPLARRALEIRRKLLSAEHLETAWSCRSLAGDLRRLQKRGEAAVLEQQALAIIVKALGAEHLQAARAFASVAGDLAAEKKFKEAEAYHRKALAIRLKAVGPDDPLLARSYRGLADLASAQGNHAAAERLQKQALTIGEKTLGETDPQTFPGYLLLSECLRKQGKNDEADLYYRKFLTAQFKNTVTWLSLAGLKVPGMEVVRYSAEVQTALTQGRFAEAELFARMALTLTVQLQGERSAAAAKALADLARVLRAQGRRDDADALVRRASALQVESLGENHPDTVVGFIELAAVLRQDGRFAEAAGLIRKVNAYVSRMPGEGAPELTAALTFLLAHDLRRQGKIAEAQKLARASADLVMQRLQDPKASPLGAMTLSSLAYILEIDGRLTEAEKLRRQSLATLHDLFGDGHPEVAAGLHSLALNLCRQGKFVDAEKTARAAAAGFQAARLQAGFTGLDRSSFATAHSPLPFLATLLARHGKPAEAWKVLEEDRARGLLDDLSSRSARPLTAAERGKEKALHDKLAVLDKRQRALAAGKPATPGEASRLREQRTDLVNQLLELQRDLEAEHGVAAGQVYGLARVQARLPANTALVVWVDIPGVKAAGEEHWACLVRHRGDPVWVRLTGSGPKGAWTQDDDDLPGKLQRQLSRGGNRGLGELEAPPPEDWHQLAKKLARQRLTPLEPHLASSKDLGPVRHLVVLPSPALAGVPLEVLTERYTVSYAPSGTLWAWLRERPAPAVKGTGALLALGDPAFDGTPGKKEVEVATAGPALAAILRGPRFEPLPGTRREVEALARLFGQRKARVLALLGGDVSAARLAELARGDELKKYRWLHLATHGYADARGGMNSYLALAAPTPDALAGRLTAGQIQRTWKLDADLVVLSACQTGLGEHQGGEGYIGFAQALFLGGSRSVALSLWSVDDNATALLMIRFYANLLGARPGQERPLSKAAALAEAKAWLRGLSRDEAVRLVEELGGRARQVPRGERPYAHPNYWAAFVLIGDPGRQP